MDTNEIASMTASVVFKCGCICKYPIIGLHSELKDWHILPCNKCATKRTVGEIEKRANDAWRKVNEPNS